MVVVGGDKQNQKYFVVGVGVAGPDKKHRTMCDRPPRTLLIPRDATTGFLVTAQACRRPRRLLPDVTLRIVPLPNGSSAFSVACGHHRVRPDQ